MKLETIFRRMRKSPTFMIGCIGLVLIVLICVSSPLFVRWDALEAALSSRLEMPDWFSNGLSGHPFGCDGIGRDILTRLLLGGRISLYIALIVTAISMFVGSLVGLISGYFGGIVDTVLMRICDMLAGVPQLMLAICVVAVLGSSIPNLIITLTITGWIGVARLIRAQVLAIKNKEFIQAAKVIGAPTGRILWKEIFPNTVTQLMIAASTHFGGTILMETSLSYLGLGVPIPEPSWGNMISDGRQYISSAPWTVIVPGIALMLTVLLFNFLGDGIRDVFDPQNTK